MFEYLFHFLLKKLFKYKNKIKKYATVYTNKSYVVNFKLCKLVDKMEFIQKVVNKKKKYKHVKKNKFFFTNN